MAKFTIITLIGGEWSTEVINVAEGKDAIRLALENFRERVNASSDIASGSALIGEGEIDVETVQWLGAWLWRFLDGFTWTQEGDPSFASVASA